VLPLVSSEAVAGSDNIIIVGEMWNTSNNELIQWQENCEFGYDFFVYSELIESNIHFKNVALSASIGRQSAIISTIENQSVY
jgi:hypothetical protein